MNRRDFLKLSGATALGVAAMALPGCGEIAKTGATSGPPEAVQWTSLASQLSGTLVRPGDAAYPTSVELFNPRFDGIRPAAIAYCETASDVQRTVVFARDHGLPLAARAGGHSYAGYSLASGGVVCDVSRMPQVGVNGAGLATVGAGARLIDVYSALASSNLAIAGGTCPTVGITGLTLGGGIGVLGRSFGLTCDSLTDIALVTAAGDLLTCNASENADLFWACRGGGGGNFGIVTSLTFAARAAPTLTIFQYTWPWPAAADVMAGWQRWISTLPDTIWSNCHALSSPGESSPAISVGGVCTGGEPLLSTWLTGLVASVGSEPGNRSVGTYGYWDGMLLEAGCSGLSVAQCHLPQQTSQGVVVREASLAHSDIAVTPLGDAALAVIVAGVEQRQANADATTVAGVAFDSLGGAINRVAADATAFVHRDGLCGIQYNATWPTGAAASVVSSNIQAVDKLYSAMRPYASGQAYQNYIDPSLVNWQQAYYGTNLPRLMEIKARHDPADLFHFPQSIPLPRR